jgi:hypothetical protein
MIYVPVLRIRKGKYHLLIVEIAATVENQNKIISTAVLQFLSSATVQAGCS